MPRGDIFTQYEEDVLFSEEEREHNIIDLTAYLQNKYSIPKSDRQNCLVEC